MKHHLLFYTIIALICLCDSYNTGKCGSRPLVRSELGDTPVVGGIAALPGSWPWIVSIQQPYKNSFSHQCVGILINNNWVLTSANCFNDVGNDLIKWRVVSGANQLSDMRKEAQIRNIAQKIVHQHYKPRTEKNDIALIRLSQPIEFSDFIQPACLPEKSAVVNRMTDCYTAGWGSTTKDDNKASDNLEEAKVTMIFQKICNSTRWYNGIIGEHNLCAGYKNQGDNSCKGDFGGPLMCKQKADTEFTVVGVHSWGSGCAQKQNQRPEVYTATQYYHDWIIATLKEDITKAEAIEPKKIIATVPLKNEPTFAPIHHIHSTSGNSKPDNAGHVFSAPHRTEAEADVKTGEKELYESFRKNLLNVIKQGIKLISLKGDTI